MEGHRARTINPTSIDLLNFVPIDDPDFYPAGETKLTELRLSLNDVQHDWVQDFSTETIAVNGNVRSGIEQVLAKAGIALHY